MTGSSFSVSSKGQPLSLKISFGDIPWFDVRGEIQRCDWLLKAQSLET
jgi:hypothetical protein